MDGGMSRHREVLSLVSTSAGSLSPRAISRSSVRTMTMRRAAGMPLPETSPTATPMRSPIGKMSKKSPPTMVEGRSMAPTSSPASAEGTVGCRRCWMSRAASRSRVSWATPSRLNQSPSTPMSGPVSRVSAVRLRSDCTRASISEGSKGLAT